MRHLKSSAYLGGSTRYELDERKFSVPQYIIHLNFLFGQNCLRIQTLLHKILHKLLCNIFHVTVCSSWF